MSKKLEKRRKLKKNNKIIEISLNQMHYITYRSKLQMNENI